MYRSILSYKLNVLKFVLLKINRINLKYPILNDFLILYFIPWPMQTFYYLLLCSLQNCSQLIGAYAFSSYAPTPTAYREANRDRDRDRETDG